MEGFFLCVWTRRLEKCRSRFHHRPTASIPSSLATRRARYYWHGLKAPLGTKAVSSRGRFMMRLALQRLKKAEPKAFPHGVWLRRWRNQIVALSSFIDRGLALLGE